MGKKETDLWDDSALINAFDEALRKYKERRSTMANRRVPSEGHSIHRPPFFDGTNFLYWKNRMMVFLRSQYYEVWRVIEKGPYNLPTDEDTWTYEQVKQSTINYNAMNIMQCAIHLNEYSKVFMCSSAKEMWDKLKLIYEGTSQVKETKANILVHDYELFKMKPEESISEMFVRLTKITNGLKGLGREYSNAELVRKVLRSLPPSWYAKVTIIEECKDLSILSLEELIGSLMTYEIYVKRIEENSKKKKSIALKATKSIKSSSEEEESDGTDDEEVALLTRQVKKFLRKKRRFQSNNNKKPPRKDNFGKSEPSKNMEIMCYKCKRFGNMRGECPEIQKKFKKVNASKSKAIVATWSDKDSDSSSSSDDQMVNLCLMAFEDDSSEVMHTNASHDNTTKGEKSTNNENEHSVTEIHGNVEPDGKRSNIMDTAMETREQCGYNKTDQEVLPMQESQPEAGTCFPESNPELLGASSTHGKLDSYEGADYAKLLNQYYEIEEKREKILQQLQQAGCWNYQSSTECQTPEVHQGFNTTNVGLQSPFYPCFGHCCLCAISPSTSGSFCPWDAYKSLSQTHQISLGGQRILASASGSMPITLTPETMGLSAHANSSSIKTVNTAAESGVSSLKFETSASSNVYDGEKRCGREETSGVDGGQKSQAVNSETDLAVVVNAWYSAGFYTGRYLWEQSMKKGLH